MPGSFAWSARATFCFQAVPATSGDMSDFTGGPPMRTLTPYTKIRSISAGVSAFMISGCAAGSLLIGELGSFASLITPTYSEWSVTPAQSSGVSILISYPSGCLIGSPLKYLYASPGSVMRFPNSQASSDQLVWTWVSPK